MVRFTPLCLAALVPGALAQVRYMDPDSSLMFNMSSVTTSSGTDLHFNMSIPSSNGWGAVGIGTMMTDALMFILLPDSTNGSTISLRTASGHRMPTPVSGMTLDVMSGSAQGGVYKASAICRSCQTWSDGSLDTKSTSQNFVYAIGPGSSGVSGTGQGATIMRHSVHGDFTLDMTAAAVSAADADAGNASGSGSGSGSGSSSGSSGNRGGVAGSNKAILPPANLVVAHASILGLTFGLLLPLGVVFLRVPSLGWIPHAAVQMLGAALAVAGLGIAIHMSLVSTPFRTFHAYHQIIGLVAISVMLLNVFLGMAHHVAFTKLKRRSVVTYVHLWTGRSVMLLGVLNMIFGFLLRDNMAGAIGVGVSGLVVYFAAFGVATFLKMRNNKKQKISSGDGGSAKNEERIVSDKPVNGDAPTHA